MTTENQGKEALARKMLRARSLEEIQALKKEVDEWLKQHPDDLVVLSAGEGFAMMEEAMIIIASRQAV